MRTRRGATLIELIAGIAITGLAVPPLVAALSMALERQREAYDRERALRLGEAIMETVLADAYGGSESLDITDPDYADGVAGRLASVAPHYEAEGYAWALSVDGPFDAAGVATGTDADRFYRATATVSFRPDRASATLDYRVSTLLTTFPQAPQGIVLGPHPLGWQAQHVFDGIEGVPERSHRWSPRDEGVSITTNWGNENIEYPVDLGPDTANWHVGITVRNEGDLGLPDWYTHFRVRIRVDGQNIGTVDIPASDTEWTTLWVDLGQRSGEIEVELRWLNDAWLSNTYDANIKIGGVQFARQPGGTP